jgi:hypothetical protein
VKHLRVVLILIVLLLGMAGEAIFTANAGTPVGRDPLTPRVYLPLVARGETTPVPGAWITVLEEGFEAAPGPLWQFRDDNGVVGGAYQWGRRDCLPFTGSYSAWAVGGGDDGINLTCVDAYPDNVQTTMIYGPFSLADAKMAQVRFMLRYDQLLDNTFAWGASSDGAVFRGRWLNGQQTGWTPLDLNLGDLDPSTPGVSVLGQPQVWVAFLFTSGTTVHTSSGPYVDDVVIRKCLDTLCSPLSAAAPRGGVETGLATPRPDLEGWIQQIVEDPRERSQRDR